MLFRQTIAMVVLFPLGSGVMGRVAVNLDQDIPCRDVAVELRALEIVTHGVLDVLGHQPLVEPVFAGRSWGDLVAGRKTGMADPVGTPLVGEETALFRRQTHPPYCGILARPTMLRHALVKFLSGGRLIPRLINQAELGGEVLFDATAATGVHVDGE